MNLTMKKILCRWFSVDNEHSDVTIGSIGINTFWYSIAIIILYAMFKGSILIINIFMNTNSLPLVPENKLSVLMYFIEMVGAGVDIIIAFILICYGLDKLSKVQVTQCNRDDNE